MNTNKFFFGMILLAVGCSSQPDMAWFEGTFSEARLQAGEKLIMVEVMTDW